jgi:hypothetical protein
MKKLAVVACGWHYPSHFYEEMIKQKVPYGYTIEYHVVMHRDPIHSHSEHDIIITNWGGLVYKELAAVNGKLQILG